MRRRNFLLVLLAIGSVCPKAWARGHNWYCTHRDSGGAYLRDRWVLVAGTGYGEAVAAIPHGERAITVLVETPAQYHRVMADLRLPDRGGLPPRSVAVFDFTADPDPALKIIDNRLRNIRVVHDLPRNVEDAQAIHHDLYTREQYLAYLPQLQALRARLERAGAIDLGSVKGQPVADYFRGIVARAGASDLVILVGHREKMPQTPEDEIPKYRVNFHDGSSYALIETTRTNPFVWVISCDTWAELSLRAATGFPQFATARPLTYSQGVTAAELLVGSKTLREGVSRVQKAQKLLPASNQQAERKRDPSEAHRPPKPIGTYHLIVELNEGRTVGTPGYIAVA